MTEELAWIRQGVRGRQAKSKARVGAYEAMVKARSDEASRERFVSGTIAVPPAPRLGDIVVQARRSSVCGGEGMDGC